MKEHHNHERVHTDSGWKILDTVLQLVAGEGLHDVMFLCDGIVYL
jgi:hypothetical protein